MRFSGIGVLAVGLGVLWVSAVQAQQVGLHASGPGADGAHGNHAPDVHGVHKSALYRTA